MADTDAHPMCLLTEYLCVCVVFAALGIIGAVHQLLQNYMVMAQCSQHLHVTASCDHSDGTSGDRGLGRVAAESRKLLQVPPAKIFLMWLAVANLLSDIGVLARSVCLLAGVFQPWRVSLSTLTGQLYAGFSLISQCFFMSTHLCSLTYMLDAWWRVCGEQWRPLSRHVHTALVWLLPLGLSVAVSLLTHIANLRGQYGAVLAVLVTGVRNSGAVTSLVLMPPLCVLVVRAVRRRVILASGRLTGREQRQIRSVRCRLLSVCVSAFICWLPSVVVDVVVCSDNAGSLPCTTWLGPDNKTTASVTALLFVAAVLRPLQCGVISLCQRTCDVTVPSVSGQLISALKTLTNHAPRPRSHCDGCDETAALLNARRMMAGSSAESSSSSSSSAGTADSEYLAC